MTDEIVAPKRAILESYVAVAEEDWNRAEICALALLGSIRYNRAQSRERAAEAREVEA